MIKKVQVTNIEVDFFFNDEVTIVNGAEVMLIKEIAISEDRISYGCLKNDGSTVWFTKSQLKGFSESREVGFYKKENRNE